jgi:predicted GNAT family N-acyltransferase
VKVVLLEKIHNRTNFNCEEESLTEYLKTQVNQDIRRKLATCFVIVDEIQNVTGYYTLTSESLGRELIPEKYSKQIPKNYNAPVILLGRLARDSSKRGTELGEYLLLDALFRSYKLSNESIGAMAVVVDPINQKAVTFYTKYGFEPLSDSKKMFLPMNVIKELIIAIDN